MLKPAGALLAWTAVSLAAGCSPRQSGRLAAPQPPPRPVELVAAALTPLAESVTAHGTLAADDDVDLSFEYAGTLAELQVDLGSEVRAGDTLAALDTTDAELQVRVAEASVRQVRARLGLAPEGSEDKVDPDETPAVRQARATLTETHLALERAQELARQSLMAGANLEAARAAHEVAESRLAGAYNEVRDLVVTLSQRRIEAEVARRRMVQSRLIAPFGGVVSARLRSRLEYVRPGDPVLTVLRTDPLRLRLRIPEREAARIATGQRVRFTAEGIAGEHEGRVQRLSPQIDPETRTLLIEATVGNSDGRLRTGLFARAEVEVGAPVPCVTVPRGSVVAFAGVRKVFLIEGDVAHERLVEAGRTFGALVEVVTGLQAGELIVRTPEGLVSGQKVSVVP